MSKRPVSVRMAELEADLENLKKQKRQLQKEHNIEERKARTHRLCKRGGEVEKLFPALATLTEEQFYLFVEKTLLTGFAERILTEIVSGKLKPTAEPQGETAERTNAPPTPKTTNTAHNGGTGGRAEFGEKRGQDG